MDKLLARSSAANARLADRSVVLCELVWVLRGVYERSRHDIVRTLEALVDTPELVIGDADLVRGATADFARGKADFADYLLGRKTSAPLVRRPSRSIAS